MDIDRAGPWLMLPRHQQTDRRKGKRAMIEKRKENIKETTTTTSHDTSSGRVYVCVIFFVGQRRRWRVERQAGKLHTQRE